MMQNLPFLKRNRRSCGHNSCRDRDNTGERLSSTLGLRSIVAPWYYLSMSFGILVQFQSIREAEIAIQAVGAYRSAGSPPAAPGNVKPEVADRILARLRASPSNIAKERVLRSLLAAPYAKWVPYPDIVDAVAKDVDFPEDAAAAVNRTRAAMRDLSEQMRPLAAGVGPGEKSIAVLAERSRTGGVLQYRLTVAGRDAVRRFFATDPE